MLLCLERALQLTNSKAGFLSLSGKVTTTGGAAAAVVVAMGKWRRCSPPGLTYSLTRPAEPQEG